MSTPPALYRTLNPANGDLVKEFDTHTDRQLEKALAAADEAARAARDKPFGIRARVLNAVADGLEANAEKLSRVMALEMGKPLAEGVAEAKKCAGTCRYYAENGEAFLRPDMYQSDARESFVTYEPLGPIFAIMPWNFPLWQVFRFVAPAIATGNTVLMKHSPNTPQSAEWCNQLLEDAMCPTGVFQNLRLTNDQAAAAMRDPRVRGVTMTGSTGGGRQVATISGHELKPTVMELGGSDPFIVLEDADLEKAAQVGAFSRCLNSGQSCIAAKRFIIVESVYDRFLELFTAEVAGRKVGAPLEEDGVAIGPMAREDLRDGLAAQVQKSLKAGAKAVLGGGVPDRPGFFLEPTILTDIPKDAPASCEELFGPVASVFRVKDEEEAIRLANATEYGLGAALFTADTERARRLVPRIEAGAVFVNGLVKSDPRLPFGGIKASGFGRELARVGMLEFTNQKTVWMG